MSDYIIIPKETSFFDWASAQAFANSDLNWPVPPKNEKEWRDWANFVVFEDKRFPAPDKIIYPDPHGWIKWAEFVVHIIQSSG